jgi:hypothetical protein
LPGGWFAVNLERHWERIAYWAFEQADANLPRAKMLLACPLRGAEGWRVWFPKGKDNPSL